jgi:thioredoxin 1
MLLELNEDTLQNVINSNDKVVVQFSASWCGNCRIMKPKFKKLATENEEITFVLIDAENNPESRQCEQLAYLRNFRGWCIKKSNTN